VKASDDAKLIRVPVSNGEPYSPEAYIQLKRSYPHRRFECEYLKDEWLRVFEIKKQP
jgi:hypothetical protein